MKTGLRLSHRNVSVRSRAYLVYRALWPELERAISAAVADTRTDARGAVLDIGCGERPYEDLFTGMDYVGLNYDDEHASPDVIADAQHLPFADNSFDIVFSTQVIEHLRDPAQMVREAIRVLQPGGRFILSGPFYWPLHEEPFDFYRFTKYGFELLLKDAGFQSIAIRGDCGMLTQVAVSIIELLPPRLWPLVALINLATPSLQRWSRNDKTTLNYVTTARKP